jgi:AbrB family looped-hinge helix DNA binding protein
MGDYATTKLSSKGQIVIPEGVRRTLGLNEGDRFVVIGQGDTVILKVITPPRLEDFQELLVQARAQAKRAGFRKADLKSAIAAVRRRAKR